MRDSICNDCAKRTRCDMAEIGRSPLAISTCYGYEKGNPSNADRIRSMTDEELDGFLNEVQGDAYLVGFYARAESRFTPYGKRWLEWLKQEANDET